MKYPVVVERGARNYGAYLPDVPGCVATGATVTETLDLLRAALRDHLALIDEHGDPIPEPFAVTIVDLSEGDQVHYVDVALPQSLRA